MAGQWFSRAAMTALCAVGFAAWSSAGHAQAPAPAACEGEALPTAFGYACRARAAVPAMTDQDYGVVRLHFTPPTSLNDVIPDRALNGTWLQALADRTVRQSVRSAVVLLEVRAVGPELPANADETGRALGLPIATVPLALYEYDSREALKFSQVQDYASRVIGRYLLLTRNSTIRVRIKVVFSQSDPSSLLATLGPIVNAAAGFGGHGFVVDAFASQDLMASLGRIESTLRSASNVDAEADNWIDLDYEGGGNRLDYLFQLNPRAGRFFDRSPASRPQGRLSVTLERRPSLFADAVLPGRPSGRQLPDYGTQGRLDSQATERIWVDARIRPGMSPARYVEETNLQPTLEMFQSAETPAPTFAQVCRALRETLAASASGLSRHDRAALFWAAFVRGASSRRYDIQEVDCIKRDRQLWADYGFALPETGPPPRRISATERDDWIETVAAPALSQQDPAVRFQLGRRLFRDRVMTNIAANTLYDAGEEPPPDTMMDRDSIARALKALQVGCRFVRRDADAPEDLPVFSMLGREPRSNKLMTITFEYAAREGGSSRVEIVGLKIAGEPSDADWEAIRATPGLRPACMRSNAAFAPVEAPPD